jgi:hypothetical protein
MRFSQETRVLGFMVVGMVAESRVAGKQVENRGLAGTRGLVIEVWRSIGKALTWTVFSDILVFESSAGSGLPPMTVP